MDSNKYFSINDIGLASSLSFLGFHYLRFDDEIHGKTYSFKNTEAFREARKKLINLKSEFKNN